MTVAIKDLPVTFTREAEIGKLRGTRFTYERGSLGYQPVRQYHVKHCYAT